MKKKKPKPAKVFPPKVPNSSKLPESNEVFLPKVPDSSNFPESNEAVKASKGGKFFKILTWDRFFTILALLGSGLALWRNEVYQKSNIEQFRESQRSNQEQFKQLNQGYLDVEVICEHRHRVPAGTKLTSRQVDTVRVYGTTYRLKITNVGNLPVTYKVTKFEVTIDKTKVIDAKSQEYERGVLYPKLNVMFDPRVDVVDPRLKGTPIGALSKADIRVKFKVTYSDIGSDSIKTVDRQYRAFVVNHLETRYQIRDLNDQIN